MVDLPKLPDKVPLWVPIAVGGAAIGAFILLRPKGDGAPGTGGLAIIQLPGGGTQVDETIIPEPEPEPEPEPDRRRRPFPIPGLKPEPEPEPEPSTTVDDIITAWADAQEQLRAFAPSWGYASWADIWQEILRNPTLFTGSNIIRKAFQAITSGFTARLNEVNDAYASAKQQLGNLAPAWRTASLREIVHELRRNPTLMVNQAARTILVNLPI